MIELDGNYGEGGGQTIRTALAFSMLTQQPFHAKDIRKGRPEPGLKAQHLHCIKALQKLSKSTAEGAELGSTELTFYPAPLEASSKTVNIGTAGSATLLLQAVLLPCMFAEKRMSITLKGGTDVRWATPIDHFTNVFVPHLRRFCSMDVHCPRRGYFPKGNGEVEITISPIIHHGISFGSLLEKIRSAIAPYDLVRRGNLLKIRGLSHASSGLKKASVAERQAHAAKAHLLKHHPNAEISIKKEYQETDSAGSGITLWASFDSGAILGADALGEQGLQSEEIGKRAALQLTGEIASGAAVDSHAADQLIPFLALAGGTIRTSAITPHAETNVYSVGKFLGTSPTINKTQCTLSQL